MSSVTIFAARCGQPSQPRGPPAPSLRYSSPCPALPCPALPCPALRRADLNPNNVLLKSDMTARAYCQPKVADFGLSVLLPEHRTHLSNLRVGTPFYMAPEVVTQVGRVRVDWECVQSACDCSEIWPQGHYDLWDGIKGT
jgi:hypothetical protein